MTLMTSSVTAADHYLEQRVLTATPVELTQMLFDACVGSIKLAMRLQESGQHLAAIPKLTKAQDILLELRTTLNHEAAPELSQRLDALYTWAWSELVQCSLKKDPRRGQAALDVVEPLQQAWRQSFAAAA